jgi:hypothetical protein
LRDFLYKFEYEDPETALRNGVLADAEYLPGYMKIRARDGEAALAWGRVLADWLVMHLFGDPEPGRWSRTIGSDHLWDALPPYRAPLMDLVWGSDPITAGEYPSLASLRKGLDARGW